jgi:hypothetical protein
LSYSIVQNQNGGRDWCSSNLRQRNPWTLQITKLFRGDKKEQIPWGRLRVYIIQQMQGQSKAEDIIVRRKTLHSTSKVMRLNGESFSMNGSFQHDAAVSANVKS